MTPIIPTILSGISNALSPSTPQTKDAGSSFNQALTDARQSKTHQTEADKSNSTHLTIDQTPKLVKTTSHHDTTTPDLTNTHVSNHQDSSQKSDQNNATNAQMMLSMLSPNSGVPSLQNPIGQNNSGSDDLTTASSSNAAQTMLSNQLANQLNTTSVPVTNDELATKDANSPSDPSIQKDPSIQNLNIPQNELLNGFSNEKKAQFSKLLSESQEKIDSKSQSAADAKDISNMTAGVNFSEQLKQSNTNSAAATAATNTQSNIHTPFGGPDWAPALNQRITWMVRDQLQNASITINPPHLGPIEVRLQTDQSLQTSIQFFSNHADVRQAISDSLPTLREMMSQSGLQLGQADVSSGSQSNSQHNNASGNRRDNAPDVIMSNTASAEVSQGVGLINTFA